MVAVIISLVTFINIFKSDKNLYTATETDICRIFHHNLKVKKWKWLASRYSVWSFKNKSLWLYWKIRHLLNFPFTNFTIVLKHRFQKYFLPLHVFLSSVKANPSLHKQINEPIVLLHLWWQPPFEITPLTLFMHSSTSRTAEALFQKFVTHIWWSVLRK